MLRRVGLLPEAMTGRKELVGPAAACRCARRIFMSPTFFGVLVVRITAEQVRPMLKRAVAGFLRLVHSSGLLASSGGRIAARRQPRRAEALPLGVGQPLQYLVFTRVAIELITVKFQVSRPVHFRSCVAYAQAAGKQLRQSQVHCQTTPIAHHPRVDSPTTRCIRRQRNLVGLRARLLEINRGEASVAV